MIYEKDLEDMVVRERLRAIKKGHPPFFGSLHEGFAIMKEEQEEFEEEYKKASLKVNDLWELIKKDKTKTELFQCVKELKDYSKSAFDEFIMFYTMLGKLEAKIKAKG